MNSRPRKSHPVANFLQARDEKVLRLMCQVRLIIGLDNLSKLLPVCRLGSKKVFRCAKYD